MAKLTFRRNDLTRLVEQAVQMKSEGLTLVGDHGVYFMNASQPPPRSCVFARGCNPDTDDTWYDKKRRTFGGDDGAEPFTLQQIQRWLDRYTIEKSVSLVITSKKIVLAGPPQ